MPSFARFFRSSSSATSVTSKGKPQQSKYAASEAAPKKPMWDDAWTRKHVAPEEVKELLQVCNQEMKSRALDMPFLLLPFRPNTDPSSAKSFIRNFFKAGPGEGSILTGQALLNEMRLIDPMVLCSIMKWCWSRLPGGVVTWSTYNLFSAGETQSNMAKHAFDTFIPLCVDSEARKTIIFDFFDLLAAIAANGKTNGMGGRKLSRLAGWWAFDHADATAGFDGGYKSWASAADATSHLFFAYLRSLAPDGEAGSSGISQLPRSLQALVAQTEYPPERPSLLQTLTPKVIMIVDHVSPTPHSLLRRAKHFEYRDHDRALQSLSEYPDPIRALTFECRRVLDAISNTNQSSGIHHESGVKAPRVTDASWSRFEDTGFSSIFESDENGRNTSPTMQRFASSDNIRSAPSTGRHLDVGRPTTPSWADFLSSGFADDPTNKGQASLIIPPTQMLPPITGDRVHSSQSHIRNGGMREDDLEPGELASIDEIELDETFWWVWMTSLAGEEPVQRKAVFGRCAFIETEIVGGRWLVMEEQLKGAVVEVAPEAYVAERKGRFSIPKRQKTHKSTQGRKIQPMKTDGAKSAVSADMDGNVNADQQAKVQAAAAELVRQQQDEETVKIGRRRARTDEDVDTKTASVMTLGLQPVIMKEAGPAMQWARKFDKESVRARYLGDNEFGTGSSRAATPSIKNYASSSTAVNQISPVTAVAPSRDLSAPTSPTDANKSLPARPATPPPTKSTVVPAPLPSEEIPLPMQAHETPAMVASSTQQKRESGNATDGNNRKAMGSSDGTKKVSTNQRPTTRDSVKRKPTTTAPPANMAGAAAAAAAAAAAMHKAPQSGPGQQEPDSAAVARSKKGSTRGFKNLFTKKKNEPEEPEALAAHRALQQKKLGRQGNDPKQRQSMLPPKTPVEDTVAPSVPEKAITPPNAPVMTEPTLVNMQDMESGEPGPVMQESRMDEEARSPVGEPNMHPNNSVTGFSDFSQGPLEDQPAFVPADEPEPAIHHAREVEPLVYQTALHTDTAKRLYIQPDKEIHSSALKNAAMSTDPRDAAHDSYTVDHDSNARLGSETVSNFQENTIDPVASQDRWAQIRKNAVAKRTSEDESRPQQDSSVMQNRKTDEGEANGEETIEARVARIRARVAQLTGQPPAGETPS